MKYFFISLLWLFFINKEAFAQNHFDFTAPNLVPFDGYFKTYPKFNFGEGVKPERFLIRPFVDKGIIKIYNSKSNMWVESGDLWTNIPDLSEEISLYLDPANNTRISLSFEIMDKYINKIYIT